LTEPGLAAIMAAKLAERAGTSEGEEEGAHLLFCWPPELRKDGSRMNWRYVLYVLLVVAAMVVATGAGTDWG